MWDQDVQDRQSLKIQASEVRKGWVLVMIPGLFIVAAFMTASAAPNGQLFIVRAAFSQVVSSTKMGALSKSAGWGK